MCDLYRAWTEHRLLWECPLMIRLRTRRGSEQTATCTYPNNLRCQLRSQASDRYRVRPPCMAVFGAHKETTSGKSCPTYRETTFSLIIATPDPREEKQN